MSFLYFEIDSIYSKFILISLLFNSCTILSNPAFQKKLGNIIVKSQVFAKFFWISGCVISFGSLNKFWYSCKISCSF